MRPRLTCPLALASLLACIPAAVNVQESTETTIDATTSTIGGTTDPDLTDAVYDPERLLRVQIEIDEDDWDALRLESRSFFDALGDEDCLSEPFGSPFEWYPADVWIDDESMGRVEIRKKGFFGSLDEDKPGLKLDLGEFDDDNTFEGVRRLTLNNSISDPSYVRQCVGYEFFREAGRPAPRCNMATVSVNGRDLGVYVNVEPIREPLLERHFDDTSGNLYEGSLSDFREGWTGTFEKKSNEEADDWSDIEALVAALEVDDDELMGALEGALDVDAFMDHWAGEVLTTHVDGYAWNTNNYYLYADPSDGRLHFIPWGIDAVLLSEASLEGVPVSVYAYGMLANRLYANEEGQARYLDALNGLLENAWDEDALLARVDQIDALLADEITPMERGEVSAAMDEVRATIEGRRDAIEEATEDGPERWLHGTRGSFCFQEIGSMDASFSTWWGSVHTEDIFSSNELDMSVNWDGYEFPMQSQGAVAGDAGELLLYMGAWVNDHEALIAYVVAEEELWTPGSFEIDFVRASAALYYIDIDTMADFAFAAYIAGDVTFTEAEPTDDAPLVGTIDGALLTWGE